MAIYAISIAMFLLILVIGLFIVRRTGIRSESDYHFVCGGIFVPDLD